MNKNRVRGDNSSFSLQPSAFRRIALGGVGLMGGSLGLRLAAMEDPPSVVAFGRTERTLERARERGAIEAWFAHPREAVRDADLVVLCAPVMSIPEQMSAIAPALKPGAVVTDVGSTKSWITAEAEKRLPETVRFVGSHPMTGSERDGIDSATPTLYEQAVTIVTPSRLSCDKSLVAVKELWRAVGSHVLALAPDQHDRIVAAVSHLPHVLASLLVRTACHSAEEEGRFWELAAGGFRDTTRIASAPAAIWRDICLTNREAIRATLDDAIAGLEEFRAALGRSDAAAIHDFFEEGRRGRERLPRKGAALLPSIIDLYVELPDRPGEIAAIAGILAREKVNIADIEIAHVRETREAAPLRLHFSTDEARVRAAEALAAAGYTVRKE